MYSTLKPENLASLTLFQCQQCSRRLQVPIVCIGVSRNICGSCYQKLPDVTDVVGNVELERMMAKLHFPCNYNKEGCTFHGSFYKTCEHELRCRFKKRSCPFVYLKKCEIDTNYSLDAMITHINEQHADNILIVKDELITIKNPSEGTPELLYLIDFDDNYFLLRTTWKKADSMIVYVFSQLSDNILFKMVKFASDAFIAMPNKALEISEFDVFQYDPKDMFTADISVLKKLNFEKEIKVFIYVKDLSQQPDAMDSLRTGLTRWKCKQCDKLANRMNFCINCSILTNCGCKTSCRTCGYDNYVKLIDLHASNIDSNFSCKSPGCLELIRGDKYDIHSNYQCRFKKHSCPLCKQQFYSREMTEHLIKVHEFFINEQALCITKLDSQQTRIFVNDDNIFIQKYHLSAIGQFAVETIKITEPYWDSSYIWKVHIGKANVACKLSIFGDCTMDGSSANVDVSAYIRNESLQFYPYVITHI